MGWKWLLMVGTPAVAVGSLLPWATINSGAATDTNSGIDGYGVITLFLSVVTTFLLILKWRPGLERSVAITAVTIGLINLSIATFGIFDTSTIKADNELLETSASIGFGLWITLLGSVAMTAGAVLALFSPPPPLPSAAPLMWEPSADPGPPLEMPPSHGFMPPPAEFAPPAQHLGSGPLSFDPPHPPRDPSSRI